MNQLPPISVASSVPPMLLNMKEALAIIDRLGPEGCCRYEWNKIRHLLCKLIGTKHLVFIDTPRYPMIRGRSVRIQNPGSYELGQPGQLLTNIKEIGIRSPESTSDFGRCHIPGAPVFYAAFNEDTVLNEIKPAIGDLVYLLYCEPVSGAQFKSVTVGEIDHVRRFGTGSIFGETSPIVRDIKHWLSQVSSEDHYVRIVVDSFLADFIRRPCSSQQDYRSISALAGVLLSLKVDYDGFAEAFYYPSVAHRGGINIALSHECYRTKVRPISCKVVYVLNCFGYGVFKTRVVSESIDIDNEGNITWQPNNGNSSELDQPIEI